MPEKKLSERQVRLLRAAVPEKFRKMPAETFGSTVLALVDQSLVTLGAEQHVGQRWADYEFKLTKKGREALERIEEAGKGA